MQKKKQRVLTPEILRLHNQVMEYLESGMLEQDHGIVLKKHKTQNIEKKTEETT